ncbi:MAG: ribonuclease J [Sulfurimonas sp. RIFOXYD12_FULL_33_39]|uniref:ribonuclease J n=1 Tax=unclassified Sulfurimonas TaxID=2623549 RepID=UPI0008AD7E5C|nr:MULTISPECIES: ribonuclease J [unclassified Sulfurimonas]OHE10952.1 MAG: ribonuclease J [Sulfurimonas sp. RIFOXYD12_FULL_33_39]OHE13279.1 MAG: ribonuclease J [Sulfurimonas sp. RIFOXYD2_FULL_34_21]DAB27886.1 MAG TPA: ribonuclease J [Sulfurimonas sp. UBA10385]
MEQENQEIDKNISQENHKPNHNKKPNNNSRSNNQNGNKQASSNNSASNKNKNASRGRRRQSTPIDEKLRTFVELNQEAHKQRLNPHYKLDLNSKDKIRITPLGGLSEIGGNITVFETQNEAILVDVGMSFPDEDMHGVDILVPDFTYIREIKDKIKGVIITHAHEDHIGAMPYLYKDMQFPIYGTPLPLAMIGNKFDEHHIKDCRQYFNPVEKRKIYKIGEDFEIEWMHMTHSIIDSSSLAITTNAGTVIHTGDFKIDHTPVDGYTADLHRLAYYGDKGVLCLLSDSTNSYNTNPTPSELSVAPALDRVFSKAEGRVILSTFSSNIHRVYQAIQYGVKHGRKVCVIGRSMERNIEIAMQYDYIKLPKNIFVEPEMVSQMNDKEILIVTTGSQGEPSSALFRMSIGEHRHVKIKPTDLIVLSSRAIPGNEGSISGMLNHLQRAGAKVTNEKDIHVSGHASIEEQKLMLRLVNPKFFLPIHGEYNHVMKHKETAMMCGVPERNIYIMNDGDTIEIAPKYMRKVKSVRTGKTYIDNQNNHKIDDDIVIDRQKLASDGIVMIVAQIDGQHSTMLSKPLVTSFGLVADKQDKYFAKEMEDVLEHFLVNTKEGLIENSKALENDLRQVVRKHIYRKMKKYPLIVPHIFVM